MKFRYFSPENPLAQIEEDFVRNLRRHKQAKAEWLAIQSIEDEGSCLWITRMIAMHAWDRFKDFGYHQIRQEPVTGNPPKVGETVYVRFVGSPLNVFVEFTITRTDGGEYGGYHGGIPSVSHLPEGYTFQRGAYSQNPYFANANMWFPHGWPLYRKFN